MQNATIIKYFWFILFGVNDSYNKYQNIVETDKEKRVTLSSPQTSDNEHESEAGR